MAEKKKCPCFSGLLYSNCCEPFHKGKAASNALVLMRSRYAAYALSLADYIMQSTHPLNSQRMEDSKQWKKEILDFCNNTRFEGLQIIEFKEVGDVATVSFRATLFQGDEDGSFTEKSLFEKKEGKWLYLSATFQ